MSTIRITEKGGERALPKGAPFCKEGRAGIVKKTIPE
jgi:hypothetical protein